MHKPLIGRVEKSKNRYHCICGSIYQVIFKMVHVNQLIHKEKNLREYQILGLPGGFSYGDDILSGKILANELRNRLKSQLDAFIPHTHQCL